FAECRADKLRHPRIQTVGVMTATWAECGGLDTPEGVKPHGCSGDAQLRGSRERLTGLPGPAGRGAHHQASAALNRVLAQAHGTSTKKRWYFYPRERRDVEGPPRIALGRCTVSRDIISRKPTEAVTGRYFWLTPCAPHCTP